MECHVIVPRREVIGQRVFLFICHINYIRLPFEFEDSLHKVIVDIPNVNEETQHVRMRFGNNTSGLTTVGMVPVGRAEAVPASTI